MCDCGLYFLLPQLFFVLLLQVLRKTSTSKQDSTYSSLPSMKMSEKERNQQILDEYTSKLQVQTVKSLASIAKKLRRTKMVRTA